MSNTRFDIEALVRPNIRRLEPYRSARGDHATGILLDANENPYPPSFAEIDLPLNRYPDPLQRRLRSRLAEINAVPDESVFVGSGSDEVIDLLMRVFCEPRVDAVVIAEPTYGMYHVAAASHDASVRTVGLTESFGLDVEALLAELDCSNAAKILFCCSPNNPTGNLLNRVDIERLCSESRAMIVVDEAYVEFAAEGSVLDMVAEHPNLVVMRTLSKAWGMAGLRVGYAIASPEVIRYLIKIKPPYNVGSLTAAAALQGLADPGAMKRTVAAIVSERERIVRALNRMPHVKRIHPSDANFVLIRCDHATDLQKSLAERGIIVRDRSNQPGLANSLRITVGTPVENDQFLERFASLATLPQGVQ